MPPDDAHTKPTENPPRDSSSSPTTPETRTGRPTASALLLGEDHAELGIFAIEEITAKLAIGISRGRFPKGYPHVDPNEDAVYAASAHATTILAVADGHNGFDAARAAITSIAESAHPVDDEPIDAVVRRLAGVAIGSVAAITRHLPAPRNASGTALTISAIRAGTIASTTLGDSACYITARRRVTRIGETTAFLTADTDPQAINVDVSPMLSGSVAVLASDGVTDFAGGGELLLRSVLPLESREGVEQLIAAAFAGGAGDNLAAAVYRAP